MSRNLFFLRRRTFAPRALRVVMLTAMFAVCSAFAGASPITYVYTGVFSGSLGATSFTDTEGTFSFTGADTDNVTTQDGLFFYNNVGVGTFQLGTMAPVSFLSSTFGVESEFGAASFMDSANNFAVAEFNYATPGDVLSVPGAPVTGDFVSYGANPESTSSGDLIITGSNGQVSFQAVAPTAVVTPEPGSLWLAGTGMICAATGFRRRMRTR